MKKYIENDTADMIYVGGRAIAPGEGREVEVPDAPAAAAAPAEPTLADQVSELHARSVAELTGALPGLTQEALDLLSEMEQGSARPRKTLLDALGAEQIRRADAALEGDDLDSDKL